MITTTYMGVTDPKAVRALSELGAEVRMGFDAQRTKLHAKAWIMDRPHGLTTAFVGSSNLSRTAMHAGLEWNVRLAEAEAASVIERMRATFETYWDDDAFEEYEPDRDGDRLEQALGRQRQGKTADITSSSYSGLDVVPYPHQRRMLEDLMVQRDRHDRHRNLVVAATGTGKTVIAALDYKELVDRAKRPLRLLFVAHREQILSQSRATFRAALKDPSFGEILSGGHSPRDGRHVFAMIQSLRRTDIEAIDPERFDVVIVDEFHHAEAPSYTALLEHLQPGELVGLTATPERMDGGDVTRWFGGRIAVELRVWEAIDRGYLAPFQYFGVLDTEDLSSLTWRRGGYDVAQLDNLFTGNDIRARRVVQAIEDWHASPNTMRALGFCVSIAHAEFMAARFSALGLDSVAISGLTPESERQTALHDLRAGRIRCIFSVDVLGEGVDVPNVDTVLLLRPTQSATVFAQQLGRGLRLSEDKAGLTVIDLVGQQHRRFRFEDRLRAIVDESNGSMRRQAEEGFPYLPSGCAITLDEQSREIVLTNLRLAATATQWRTLVEELQELGDVDLDAWAHETGRRISDLYRQPDRSWTRLRRDAGLPTAPPAPGEDAILRTVRRLDHIDDPERTGFYFDVLTKDERPDCNSFTTRQQRLLTMLLRGLDIDQKGDSLDSALARLWPHSAVRDELVELFMALDDRSERQERPLRDRRGRASRSARPVHARRGPSRLRRRRRGRAIGVSRRRALAPGRPNRPALRHAAQVRAVVLAHDDVPRLRALAQSLPLGVPERNSRRHPDRPALRQPRGHGHEDHLVRPRIRDTSERCRLTIHMPRAGPVRLPRRQPADASHVGARASPARGAARNLTAGCRGVTPGAVTFVAPSGRSHNESSNPFAQ